MKQLVAVSQHFWFLQNVPPVMQYVPKVLTMLWGLFILRVISFTFGGNIMDTDILVNTGIAEEAFLNIETMITANLSDRKSEYMEIAVLFEKSKGEYVEALKELLLKEKETVDALEELFRVMVQMLRDASVSMNEVEEKYTVNRVEGRD